MNIMKHNLRFHRLSLLFLLVLFIAVGASTAHAQYLKAFVGVGKPDIADGAFDGTTEDIIGGTGEWGNFLLLDFGSSDPGISVNTFTIDFGSAADATIDSVYLSGHNQDGAVFVSASLNNNVYTATFTGITDAVDVLYIHFDFDKPSFAGGGTPLGQDYIGATITATLSDGTVLSGTFDVVDFFTAMAQIGVPGQSVDVWIRDCNADIGDVPSNTVCPQWFTSPDIFIDNDLNGILDAPVYGGDNTLRAVVHNRGSEFAENVNVDLYYRNNTTGLVFPDGANLIGSSVVNVPPNSSALVSVPWANLPAAPSNGHWCIGAVLNHAYDPAITPAVIPYEDNNVGIANMWHIAGRAGQRMDISFSAATGSKSGFGFTSWPRDFILRVKQDLPGWTTTIEGAEAGSPFALQLGEEKKITVRVDIPEGVRPHTAGAIKVEQVDVETGKVVGGVIYNIYEDHQPPEPVDKIAAMVGEKSVVLTWEGVQIEEKTGLEERVAYYEIYRNGRPYKKLIRDEDPFSYGMQWTDRDLSGDTLTYAVRVVDEGGNISATSPNVVVTLHDGRVLFNWLTWLLLILLLLFFVLFIMKRRPARS